MYTDFNNLSRVTSSNVSQVILPIIVGIWDGNEVGEGDGGTVGNFEGCADPVGAGLGGSVGYEVGADDIVGCSDTEGRSDGRGVGFRDGGGDGTTLGFAVVGAGTGLFVGAGTGLFVGRGVGGGGGGDGGDGGGGDDGAPGSFRAKTILCVIFSTLLENEENVLASTLLENGVEAMCDRSKNRFTVSAFSVPVAVAPISRIEYKANNTINDDKCAIFQVLRVSLKIFRNKMQLITGVVDFERTEFLSDTVFFFRPR